MIVRELDSRSTLKVAVLCSKLTPSSAASQIARVQPYPCGTEHLGWASGGCHVGGPKQDAQFIVICSSAKTCEIGENLLFVSDLL
jgi:hypothetical protein